MESLKLLLLIVLPAIVVACIVGVVFGKHQIKKENGRLRPVLGKKERIVYSASMALGVVLLLVGFLYNPAPDDGMAGMDGMDPYGDMGMEGGDMTGLPNGDIMAMPEGEIITGEPDPALNVEATGEEEPVAGDEAPPAEGESEDGEEPEAEAESESEGGEDEASSSEESTTAETVDDSANVAVPAPRPAVRAPVARAVPAG
ncbi:MAG: hypothetical protein LBU86_07600 [Oscillospiraceae bacterium]|jgi:hypothetical protein|nr:hypothetical protein [Oscillospiraceae bacterium]